MKQIIDSVLYDTESENAEEVARYSNGLGPSDFNYIIERLYRTKKGRWFIAGEGGAMTGYSKAAGNMRSNGQEIRPVTEEEAQRWLERHNFVDEAEEHFSDHIEEA